MGQSSTQSSTHFITVVIQFNMAPSASGPGGAPATGLGGGGGGGGFFIQGGFNFDVTKTTPSDNSITTVVVSDDALPNQIIQVTIRPTFKAGEAAQKASLVLRNAENADQTQYQPGRCVDLNADPCGFILKAPLVVINNLLGPNFGIGYGSLTASDGSSITIDISDLGAGLNPQDPTKAKSFSLVILLSDPAIVAQTGAVGAAPGLVGVATLMSMGTYGVYKVMKKKKIIPEEADPWENDTLWDATLDNPLFSGAPGTGTIYE